jgi:hypothetical protein
MIADNLKKAGWSLGWVSAVDREGRTIWIVDAHRDDGKRFVVRADGKLAAFLEVESAIFGLRLNGQPHHGMNFPCCIARHVLATVALMLRSVADVPERFTQNRALVKVIRYRPKKCKRLVGRVIAVRIHQDFASIGMLLVIVQEKC